MATKRFGFVAVVCVAALVAIAAPAASAADSYTCQFSGVETAIPPFPALSTGIVTSNGQSQLRGTATCVHVDADFGEFTRSSVFNTALNAPMNYTQVGCLSGTRVVSPSNPVVLGGDLDGPASLTWTTPVAATQATMSIPSAWNSGHSTGVGAGVAEVIPADGNCVTTNVANFSWTGAFSFVTQ